VPLCAIRVRTSRGKLSQRAKDVTSGLAFSRRSGRIAA
jgi:hypothetical protein